MEANREMSSPNLNEVFVHSDFNCNSPFLNMPLEASLRGLDISHCEEITDAGLLGAIFYGPLNEGEKENPTENAHSNLKDLRTLHLGSCKVTVETLNNIFENHSKIAHLGVAHLPITDELLFSLPRTLRDLDYINLIGCHQITSGSVLYESTTKK